MAEEVLSRVVFGTRTLENTNIKSTPATLTGYKRYRLHERDYPGVMRASPNDTVEGKLIFNLDDAAIKKLDVFEGSEYTRETITATTRSGESYSASIYVFNDASVLDKDAGDWQFDEFQMLKMRNWIADELREAEGLGGRFWDTEQVRVVN